MHRPLVIAILLLAACSPGETVGTSIIVPAAPLPSSTSATAAPPPPPTTTTADAATTNTPPSECLVDGAVVADGALLVFALCGDDQLLFPSNRDGDLENPLQSAVQALVFGTTPDERALGLFTGFDFVEERAEIRVEALVQDGVAVVDFFIDDGRWSPGARAGTSHQLVSFVDPLYATVFSFDDVDALDLSGLCWGELGCDGVLDRLEWETMVFTNQGSLLHGPCDLVDFWNEQACRVDSKSFAPTGTVIDVAADDVLHLRSGPGVEYPIIGEAAPGADIDVSETRATAADGGTWVVVRNDVGTIGWVNARFVLYTVP